MRVNHDHEKKKKQIQDTRFVILGPARKAWLVALVRSNHLQPCSFIKVYDTSYFYDVKYSPRSSPLVYILSPTESPPLKSGSQKTIVRPCKGLTASKYVLWRAPMESRFQMEASRQILEAITSRDGHTTHRLTRYD